MRTNEAKRFNGRSSVWADAASIFDLYGVNSLSKKKFDEIRTKKSNIKIPDNELESFLQDFWASIAEHGKEIEINNHPR